MKVSLEQLAAITGSTIQGDKNIELSSVLRWKLLQKVKLVFSATLNILKHLVTTNASAVILPPELAGSFNGNVLVNKNPYLTFAKVLSIIHKEEIIVNRVHATAVVADDVVIENECKYRSQM